MNTPMKLARLGAACLVGLIAPLLLAAAPASAHVALAAGEATCDTTTGRWLVTWTVTNTYPGVATLSGIKVQPHTGTLDVPAVVPAAHDGTNGKATIQSRVDGTEHNIRLSLRATWPDGFAENVEASVTAGGQCSMPSAPPTSPPNPSPVIPAKPQLPLTGPGWPGLIVTATALIAGGVGLLLLVRRRRRVRFTT